MTAHDVGRTFVPYLRVSTDKQGRHGLGMEAQEAAIKAFLRPCDRLLAPPFVEVETGNRSDRPQLQAALARCKATGATLLIAKLDRLARSVHFISGLMEARVPFLAVDMPNATPFMLHVYAAVAEEEARAISRRTKAALAAAKARGIKLGGQREGSKPPPLEAARKGAALGTMAAAVARITAAEHAAHRALPRIAALRSAGASLASVAGSLTKEGVPTPRGGTWTATAIRRVIARSRDA